MKSIAEEVKVGDLSIDFENGEGLIMDNNGTPMKLTFAKKIGPAQMKGANSMQAILEASLGGLEHELVNCTFV